MPPHLVAVPPLDEQGPTSLPAAGMVTFCSHCGSHAGPVNASRVCRRCEMGLLLQAHPGLAPEPGDAFVVCDADLLVCALSRGAEELLGVFEPAVIHQSINGLLAGISRNADGIAALPSLLREAAAGGGPAIERTIVAIAGQDVGRCPARVGPCGRPSAALLVIDAPLP